MFIQSLRAGVSSPSFFFCTPFGLTEDARGPGYAVWSGPASDAFVALQGYAQLLHHNTKGHALTRKKDQKAMVRTHKSDIQFFKLLS